MAREVKVTAQTRNVNSKLLLQSIMTTFQEVCDEYIVIRSSIADYTYDYSQLADFADMLMEDMMERKQIFQYDVICDHRNNDEDAVRHGIVVLHLKYRQMYCLNETSVKLTFEIRR